MWINSMIGINGIEKEGVQHCVINSLLYITTMREKHVRMYEKFISQL